MDPPGGSLAGDVLRIERLVEGRELVRLQGDVRVVAGRRDARRVRGGDPDHPLLRGRQDLRELRADLEGRAAEPALAVVEGGEERGDVERVRDILGAGALAIVAARRREGGGGPREQRRRPGLHPFQTFLAVVELSHDRGGLHRRRTAPRRRAAARGAPLFAFVPGLSTRRSAPW